jgi:outer membrane protein assembly factor BamB
VVVDLPVSGGAFGWASPLDKPDAIYLAQENPPMIDRIGKSPLKGDWRFALSETRTYDRFFIGGLLSTPTGVVSVFREKGSGRLILVSIDGATGKILWTLSLSETSADVPEEIVNMVSSDGVLYVPSPEKGDILAVSMDGQLLWKTHVGDHPHTGGTAIGRLLFIPLPSGHIVALDRLNGQKVHEWVGKAPLGPLPLPVIGSMVFLADRRGVIQAMDLSSLGEKADLLSRTSFLKPKDPSMDIVGGRPGE